MTAQSSSKATDAGRRDFLKSSSVLVAGGAIASGFHTAYGADGFGDQKIKIGLVGCGGRGTGAAAQAMNTMKKEFSPNGKVELAAMADVFQDRMDSSLNNLKRQHGDSVTVSDSSKFIGLEAYKQVMESDVDLVILTTPPGFRPLHFDAAVAAGKHVFMEKPVATDSAGVRRVLAVSEIAKKKGLAVAVGLQRHHEPRYTEGVKRVQDGAIGDVLFTRVYWNGRGVWTRPRKEGQTELEYQLQNWYYFNWLCGDHINEQHIHNLDVGNWVVGDYPTQVNGMGGRQVRTSKEHGEIYDHHFCEYTYANGVKMYSQCRHQPNCFNSVSEYAHGTKGVALLSRAKIEDNDGNEIWSYGRGGGGGHQEEHYNLFADIRQGKIPNEAEYGAKSTMTAIMGRMATYSGKVVEWDDAINSKIALADFDNITKYTDTAPVQPNEDLTYNIPMPGRTRVI